MRAHPSSFPFVAIRTHACSCGRSPPVVDAAAVCTAVLPLPGVRLLALSGDQQLVAAVGGGGAVHLFALSALAAKGPGGAAAAPAPLATLQLGAELLDFQWRPAADGGAELGQYLALTRDRRLLRGAVSSGAAAGPAPAVEGRVDAFSWAPDGRHFAYSRGARLAVAAADGGGAGAGAAPLFEIDVNADAAREFRLVCQGAAAPPWHLRLLASLAD